MPMRSLGKRKPSEKRKDTQTFDDVWNTLRQGTALAPDAR